MHLIDEGRGAVGMFRIDPAFERRVPGLPEGTHGLRGLMIDAEAQGRGLGRRVLEALPAYVRATFPGLRRLWLTVDAPNARAHRLYLCTGWVPGGPDFDGSDGPEHLLRLDL